LAWLGVACAAVVFHSTTLARAEDGAPRPDYWSRGTVRPFVSSRLDAGLVYAKPQVALGYGKPYWSWVGLEAYALSTHSLGAGYVGVRGALPFANASFGVRDSYSYTHSFLVARDRYDADDLARDGPRARYLTLETEAFAAMPVPGGYAFVAPMLYVVTDAPTGKYLYEESLRAVMKPPYLWATRFAYLFALGVEESVKVGPMFEYLGLPGRGESIQRAGPAVNVKFTEHCELVGIFSVVLSSPDSLGLRDGPFGLVGIRYYVASGEPDDAPP
jgi:hypothetical protein